MFGNDSDTWRIASRKRPVISKLLKLGLLLDFAVTGLATSTPIVVPSVVKLMCLAAAINDK